MTIMKPRIYIESTIPSYLTALSSRDLIVAGHQQITQDWWRKRKDKFSIFISQFVLDEVSAGDPDAALKRLAVVDQFELLEITKEVTDLAEAIIASGIIPQSSPTDAAHIAIATAHCMDYLMTWNCAHIANAEIFTVVRNICNTHGYDCPVICTSEELLGG